jgi:hypothetical protein
MGGQSMTKRWYGVSDAKLLKLDEEETAYFFIEWYNRAHQKGYSAESIEPEELERLYPAFRSWLRYKNNQLLKNDDATIRRMGEYVIRLENIIRVSKLREAPLSRMDVWRWYWRVFAGIIRRDHDSNRRIEFAREYCSLPRIVRWRFRKFKLWYEVQVAFWLGEEWSPGYGSYASRWEKTKVRMTGFVRRKAYALRMGFVTREIERWKKAYSAAHKKALEKWKSGKGPKP